MRWAGMYFLGFSILMGGVLAALWKLGILQHIETSWILIGVAILAHVQESVASAADAPNRLRDLARAHSDAPVS